MNGPNALQSDRIFISHRHDVEDGFPNLEDMGDVYLSDDQRSGSSSTHNSNQKAREGSKSARFIDQDVSKRLCLHDKVLIHRR